MSIVVILVFSILSFLLGIVLGYFKYIFPVKKDPMVVLLDNLLPQSQCAQCGYSGCLPYADAIVNKNEKINKCIPGGKELILKISNLLNIDNLEEYLDNKMKIGNKKEKHTTVWIDEKNCVGCAKCASFCPVDAIVGAPNFIHTVLQEFCTGCNICLLHCPTDCIKII